MRTPTAAHDYHVVRFDHSIDAAAFVATLTRYLESPRGSHYVGDGAPLEVWIDSNAHEGVPVELYLSAGALAATAQGFQRPPLQGMRRGDELSADCALVVGALPHPQDGELPS